MAATWYGFVSSSLVLITTPRQLSRVRFSLTMTNFKGWMRSSKTSNVSSSASDSQSSYLTVNFLGVDVDDEVEEEDAVK